MADSCGSFHATVPQNTGVKTGFSIAVSPDPFSPALFLGIQSCLPDQLCSVPYGY